MTNTAEVTQFHIEVDASVEAADGQHALILVALELLQSAFTYNGEAVEFGPIVSGGCIGSVGFTIEAE